MRHSAGWLACAMAGLIVGSASGVAAQPMVLADDDLDRTTAGSLSGSVLERLAGVRDRLAEYGVDLGDVWDRLDDLSGVDLEALNGRAQTIIERHVSKNGNGTSVVESHTVVSHYSYSSRD